MRAWKLTQESSFRRHSDIHRPAFIGVGADKKDRVIALRTT
jgi:hypothetical protein